ncbi:HAD-IA family hydrolase [Mycolicibacterium mengxianglii]|uniref:HAD-IA family hydrolase n=1 Tax=Mycolicibacterium mengxianglii TaxID=2736649 RepID=UPI0027DAA132|nr:HAD-IA family hydrolase [Mycolicibacterium mengxianglii]
MADSDTVAHNETVAHNVDGLLLDCDGVLVDSHDAAAVAWNTWAKRWAPGFDFHRDIEHGRRIRDVVAELVKPPGDVDAATADLIQQEIDHATDVTAIPGARRLLGSCPAGRWAVVTSGGRAIATARMASAGLRPAEILVTGEDVENGKPSPDPYLLAAKRLGIPPGRCAVFEDAPAGIAAARAAGVTTIIGVGAAAASAPVTLAVTNLRGVRFDGHKLLIDASTILPGQQFDL